MKASEFINEAAIGTNPKRPARAGSRPNRGHKEEPRYKEQDAAEGQLAELSPDTLKSYLKKSKGH